jgi:hypothetical protein
MSMPTAIGLDVPSKLSVCHGSSLSIPKISNFKDFKWVGPNGFTATQNDIVIPNVNDSMQEFILLQLIMEILVWHQPP